ncbi:Cyclic nucleotide-binding domain-containing protein [Polaromonas sp. OV174]|uniref:Crp/Fnr family transcriptional regulator n=1 Tax=Polaromonas sp. OV174 TaxID=1855300 RepID=UPI0008E322A6|nr:Crp/Fnr family transcriptional regulator [Polaromonas sp. OV174]SFC07567.1 Cyclic nucleotide-binding domain-containing protein [Polaromonas sp. OV174]
MKGLLGLLKQSSRARGDSDGSDSLLFSTAFAEQGIDASKLIPWEARANEVGAKRLSASRGCKLLQALWAKDRYMAQMATHRLEHFFEFATVPANRDIIRQDEYGDFMIVLLTGTIAVDREQPWGERLRLTETRQGDILGEMSLLDSGMRFSVCTSLNECEIAVLSAQALDEMMAADPALAASMIALLARKLSRRLRVVSARLSEKKS